MKLEISIKELNNLKKNLCPSMITPESFDFLIDSLKHLTELRKNKRFENMNEVFELFNTNYLEVYGSNYVFDAPLDFMIFKSVVKNARKSNVDLKKFFNWAIKTNGAKIQKVGLRMLPSLLNFYILQIKKDEL